MLLPEELLWQDGTLAPSSPLQWLLYDVPNRQRCGKSEGSALQRRSSQPGASPTRAEWFSLVIFSITLKSLQPTWAM